MMESDPFRIRDYVTDFDAIVAGIVASSAAARAALPMKADIAYGNGPSETLDLFFPTGASEPLPVHIFIHGGYWRMFSKNDYSCIANTVIAAGAIAVIVDYALMPSVRMEVIVDQVRRARNWVRDHIAEYGGDPARITVSGHSAGAHLASCLFTADQVPTGVGAALLLSGLYDLEPLRSSFLQAEIGLTDKEVSAFTPLSMTHDAGTRVEILIGARETEPFHAQADDFARHLDGQGLNVSQQVIVARNHMNIVRDLGDPHTITGRRLTRLIAS
jgi:arylformamidase